MFDNLDFDGPPLPEIWLRGERGKPVQVGRGPAAVTSCGCPCKCHCPASYKLDVGWEGAREVRKPEDLPIEYTPAASRSESRAKETGTFPDDISSGFFMPYGPSAASRDDRDK